MAKAYSPEDLATRTFVVSVLGIGAFVAAVFLFIL